MLFEEDGFTVQQHNLTSGHFYSSEAIESLSIATIFQRSQRENQDDRPKFSLRVAHRLQWTRDHSLAGATTERIQEEQKLLLGGYESARS